MFPLRGILTPFLSLKTGISRSRSKNTHVSVFLIGCFLSTLTWPARPPTNLTKSLTTSWTNCWTNRRKSQWWKRTRKK
ncbi:uncharacterized protein DS421_6g186920 [Arachis hypogaea]|nr:uncharacterized protein DS421_6g186920 [Arachis hypogaea]